MSVILIPVVRHGTDQLFGSRLRHGRVIADHLHASAFCRCGDSRRIGVVRENVATLTDQRVRGVHFLTRIIPGVGPHDGHLHVRINALGTQRVSVDSLKHLGNRHGGHVTQMSGLAHGSGEFAREITGLIKARVVVAVVGSGLVSGAVFKLYVRKLLGYLECRIHVREARGKDDLVALSCQITNDSLGVHRIGDVVDHLSPDLLLGPTFIGARARIDPGGLERFDGGNGLFGLLVGGGVFSASGQQQAGGGGHRQGNFLESHSCLFLWKHEQLFRRKKAAAGPGCSPFRDHDRRLNQKISFSDETSCQGLPAR